MDSQETQHILICIHTSPRVNATILIAWGMGRGVFATHMAIGYTDELHSRYHGSTRVSHQTRLVHFLVAVLGLHLRKLFDLLFLLTAEALFQAVPRVPRTV